MTDESAERKPELFDDGTLSQKILLTVLAIGAAGLCVAVVGIAVGHETIYYVGLILAAPLFIVVLPVCLLLIGLMLVFCAVQGIIAPCKWLMRRSKR